LNHNLFAPFFDFSLPKVWKNKLEQQIPTVLKQNGHLVAWLDIFNSLPRLKTDNIDFARAQPVIGTSSELSTKAREKLAETLIRFHPWRKGPFSVFGIDIDTEWQSNLKWERLKNHIRPLSGKRVLDVGCGNGYYMLQLLGAGAVQVTGIEPNILYILQFESLLHFTSKRPNACIYPVKLGEVPENLQIYDSVFSMGVLYHSKSPFEHLLQLKGALKPGGQLILETLVVDGVEGYSLLPKGRYAKMPNVWQIPGVVTLEAWLQRTGFKNIKTVNVSVTDELEQRKTRWMAFESLEDFLNPQDKNLTVEGYPAPKRAICIAEK